MADLEQKAYGIIMKAASNNIIAQGVSALFGPVVTTGTDLAVTAVIYLPMINNIRHLYGRSDVVLDDVKQVIKGCGDEILMDFLYDKLLGNIPLVGVPFNIVCARSMTWRLGILFAMLSARGEKIDEKGVNKSMKLIRKKFPKNSLMLFKPKKERVTMLVSLVKNKKQTDYNEIVEKLLTNLE